MGTTLLIIGLCLVVAALAEFSVANDRHLSKRSPEDTQ